MEKALTTVRWARPSHSAGHGADEDDAALHAERQTEARVKRPAREHVVEHDPPD
jgi:hypothetical protein